MAKGLYEKQKEARRLRQEEGLSLNEIVAKVEASKGSVSKWVRDVPLTDEHKVRLYDRNPTHAGTVIGREKSAKAVRALWAERRKKYQDEGRMLAAERNVNFIAGCMLYWAEGAKNKNSVVMTNTDAAMLRLFVGFLRMHFAVRDDEWRVTVRCYSKMGMSVAEIERYWLQELGLPKECLCKTEVDHDKRPTSGQKVKYLYGTCRLNVNRTDIVQKIFGAIQQYAGFENEKWLG